MNKPVIKYENGYQLISVGDGTWKVYTDDDQVGESHASEAEARAAAKALPPRR
ncbi:DUF2188 domain-containing protein [Pseudomonas viridiflava]|uniref:DUF2188 domain-containing protein n=1 Tax=Pseudomonas syringae group TaxID=136849 RepID=UPI000F036D7E|nr:DUF2188 domain-containing protein [Pseudomonas viridiflava]